MTFAGTPLRGATVTGMPLRREIALLDRKARRAEALATFGLDPQWPTVLVTGGSLGAQRINEAFRTAMGSLRAAGVQVLHVTGVGKEFAVEEPGAGAPYVVVPYADRMEARLRRGRHRRGALGGQHGLRASRRSASRRPTSPCPSATASSASTQRRSSPPVADSSSRTRRSPRPGSRRPSSRCCVTRPAWARWLPPPRQWASATVTSLLADLVVDAASGKV